MNKNFGRISSTSNNLGNTSDFIHNKILKSISSYIELYYFYICSSQEKNDFLQQQLDSFSASQEDNDISNIDDTLIAKVEMEKAYKTELEEPFLHPLTNRKTSQLNLSPL